MAMSARAWAQGPVDGAIRGHVSAVCGPYPQRCVAGDVRVHLTSPDQGVERDVDADGEGDFLLLRLPPGEYELRATSRTEGGQGVGGIAVARLDLEGGDLDEVTLTLGAPRPSLQAAVPGLSLGGFGRGIVRSGCAGSGETNGGVAAGVAAVGGPGGAGLAGE